MKIVIVNSETKAEQDALVFSQATYHLHESFGDRAKQGKQRNTLIRHALHKILIQVPVIKQPPFRVAEDGWGEFELKIDLVDLAGRTHEFLHDLNFQQSRYEVKHVITFKNPKPALLAALRDSGPVPGDVPAANGEKKSVATPGTEKKKKKSGESSKGFDMDKLAEGLQKLGEDDLLQVVQMVHDHKTDESWMRNDVERKSAMSKLGSGA